VQVRPTLAFDGDKEGVKVDMQKAHGRISYQLSAAGYRLAVTSDPVAVTSQ
jgi:hypothetical protein